MKNQVQFQTCVTKVLGTAGREFFSLASAIHRYSPEATWIAGGALRDHLLGTSSDSSDVDLVFFNEQELSKQYEDEIGAKLISETGLRTISVKNQARICSLVDGCRHADIFRSVEAFPDVTVAMAVKAIDVKQRLLSFYIPYGLKFLDQKKIVPTSAYLARHSMKGYRSWVDRKRYESRLLGWELDTAPCSPTENAFYLVKVH